MSAHPLPIEAGRYSSDSDMYDQRFQRCTCNDLNLLRHLPEFDPVVESEWHLLYAFPYYHDLRSELPDWILSELLSASGDFERQPEGSILHFALGRFGRFGQEGSGQEEGVPG